MSRDLTENSGQVSRSAAATADLRSDVKRHVIQSAHTDTRLFRVATKLFNHLLLNGTVQDQPASTNNG
jgi:hypothetical protein